LSRFDAEVSATRLRMQSVAALLTAVVQSQPQNHPGHADQKAHGRKGGATGQAALDAVPATFTAAPDSHYGQIEGSIFDAPPGAGDPKALAEYEGLEYERTNGYLRDPESWERLGTESSKEIIATAKDHIKEIDQTMEVSRTTEDVEVSRVIQDGSTVFGQAWHEGVINADTKDFDEQDREHERWIGGERPNLTGVSWTERAYVSTSANPDHSVAFGERWARTQREYPDSQGEPVIMTISVPKGTGAVQLGNLGTTKTPSGKEVMGSAEILLERGLTMTVTADHGVDENGFRQLDVEASRG
jgi:hypothetical protein